MSMYTYMYNTVYKVVIFTLFIVMHCKSVKLYKRVKKMGFQNGRKSFSDGKIIRTLSFKLAKCTIYDARRNFFSVLFF